MKESVSSFLNNLVSVVLGIAITFFVQGIIDRAQDKQDVRAALDLVRAELTTNMADVADMTEYLHLERTAARYILEHRKNLRACPDSLVKEYSGIIFANASITLRDDALELLKMSSLFQKIGDNDLSLKIIRAYDTGSIIASSINHHIEERNELFAGAVNERTFRQMTLGGSIDIWRYIKTPYGEYTILWLTRQGDISTITDVSDLQAAVDAIDIYQQGRRAARKAARAAGGQSVPPGERPRPTPPLSNSTPIPPQNEKDKQRKSLQSRDHAPPFRRCR